MFENLIFIDLFCLCKCIYFMKYIYSMLCRRFNVINSITEIGIKCCVGPPIKSCMLVIGKDGCPLNTIAHSIELNHGQLNQLIIFRNVYLLLSSICSYIALFSLIHLIHFILSTKQFLENFKISYEASHD